MPGGTNPSTKRVTFAPCETGSGESISTAQQATVELQVDGGNAWQEFPDVPGSESMEFMEAMMANLRRVVQTDG